MPLPNASKQELFLRSVATSRLDHAVTRALRPASKFKVASSYAFSASVKGLDRDSWILVILPANPTWIWKSWEGGEG